MIVKQQLWISDLYRYKLSLTSGEIFQPSTRHLGSRETQVNILALEFASEYTKMFSLYVVSYSYSEQPDVEDLLE